jgi:signal transduction histidine kinase
MKIKSKHHYILISFVSGFIFCLVGVSIEDYSHNISIRYALSNFRHFLIPACFGLVTAILGYYYWMRRIQQSKAINQFTENLHSLLDVNKALVSSIELDTVLQIIIDKSTQLINLDTGAIYLHEEEKLYLGATTPPLPEEFPDILRYDLLANHPHIQNTLFTKQPTIVPDTSKAKFSEAEQAVVKIRNLRSIVYIPLIIENRPVGTLILGTTNNLRTFESTEIDMYRTFSGQAALSIENARLYKKSILVTEELRQQNEEFLSLNEELSESNLRIQKINDDLTLSKEKAEESDRLKSAFLQNMSHEVRTPLNAITGFSMILTEPDQPSDRIQKFADIISSSSNKLMEIITDVIEISQIQSKLIYIGKSDFCFLKLVTDIVQEFKPIIEKKELELTFSLNILNKEWFVSADKIKLYKILKHLLDNAVKFTGNGQIKLELNIFSERIEFIVSDTGIGISKDMQQKIFEPFRQIETGICRNYGGNGLGLSIVKAYTEMLGGEITLQSEPNIGTKIKVSLPVIRIPIRKETVKDKRQAGSSLRKVLIVEDEQSNYEYLAALLSRTDAILLYATNGQNAIDVCRTENQLDFILMDIKMPIMDGHTATKLIKAFRPDLPIIAQTAYAMECDKELFLESGFDAYVCKPITDVALFEAIDSVMNK